jgi:hypothetical protein
VWDERLKHGFESHWEHKIMNTFLIIPILAIPAIYILSAFISRSMSYEKGYWFFEALHLLAGFFVAMFWSNFLNTNALVIMATLAVGILWEVWEVIVDRQPKLKNILRKFHITQGKITLQDTTLDLFLDFAGALIFVLLLK